MKLRTFLAIELDPPVRKHVSDLIAQLSTDTAATKWVEPENLHLTVKFLGDVDDKLIPDVCSSTADAAAEHDPFVCECKGMGAFPHDHRPRTVWIGVHAGQDKLISLHTSLEKSLSKLGFRHEGRRFHPHVTIGRVRGGQDVPVLASAISSIKDIKLGTFQVSEVIVFSSEMRRQGPVYTVLAKTALGAAKET